MACILDPDIAVLFFFIRQQKLICRKRQILRLG